MTAISSHNLSEPAEKAPRGSRKTLNLLLLVTGYGIGQGGLFLSQSWLVASNQLASLSLFGTAFSFAILAITLVEAGSITVLARVVARDVTTPDGADGLWQTFWSITALRTTIAVAATVIAAIAVLSLANDYYLAFLLCSAPAVLVWSINVAGILDGTNRSGASGLSGAIPYLTSAATLPFSVSLPPFISGAAQGGALSAGYVLAVGLQYIVLWRLGKLPRPARVDRHSFVHAAATGMHMLATMMPGQLLFRFQLLLSGWFLGQHSTALIIYAYQLIAAGAQLTGFIRRVEFPRLVAVMSATQVGTATVLKLQRVGTAIACVLFSVLLTGSVTLMFILPEPSSTAGYTVAWFSISILTSALSLALLQGLQAAGLYSRAALATNVGVAFAVVLSVALVVLLDVPGLALANAASQIVTGLVAVKLLNLQRHGA